MFFGLLLQGKEYVYHALRRDAELVLELLGLRPETEIRTEKIDMASCSLERAPCGTHPFSKMCMLRSLLGSWYLMRHLQVTVTPFFFSQDIVLPSDSDILWASWRPVLCLVLGSYMCRKTFCLPIVIVLYWRTMDASLKQNILGP